MPMSDISKRLKEERQRLGLSQVAFAEKAGVHSNTQRKYESGEREPDTAYLTSIKSFGVDAGYVLIGLRGIRPPTRDEIEQSADQSITLQDDPVSLHTEGVGHLILSILGIPTDSWNELARKSVTRVPTGGIYVDANAPAWGRGLVKRSPLISRLIKDAEAIDVALLSGVLSQVESLLDQSGLTMQTEKKAQATALLYRAFKASGKIDQAMIEEAVKLAAG